MALNKLSTNTIEYNGIEFEATYDYEPYEPDTWSTPGCPSRAIIDKLHHKGVDFTEFLESFADMDEIENLILEKRWER